MKRCGVDKISLFRLMESKSRETVLFLGLSTKSVSGFCGIASNDKICFTRLIHNVLYSLLGQVFVLTVRRLVLLSIHQFQVLL
jgi:hypothetical protein